MGTARTDTVTIGSVTGRLQMRDGVRSWRTQRGRYSDEDNRPFTTYIPFGYAGMGMSAMHDRGRNQHDYSLDFDVDTWNRTNDRLQLGLEQNSVTLSLTNVTKITEAVADSSGNLYVYIVNDSAVLPKIRLDTMASTGSKTFSHGGGTPLLTDLLVVKSGTDVLTTGGSRAVNQVGNGILMASFGNSAPLSQTDAIASNAVDTWSNTAATAYGGVLAKVKGTSAGETWLWKSSGVSGGGYVNGAFSRLMYLAASTSSSLDYSNTSLWNPATPYQVGDFGSTITGMTEYARGLVVAKPEGVYAFDANFNDAPIATFRGYLHDSNGRSITAWLNTLAFQTRRDIGTPQGLIGITKLVSNMSPIQGYPTALCAWGDRLFAAYYDSTDTYIVMLKPREGESIESPFVIWPITKLASKTCYAMRVVTRADGSTILIYGKGGDIGWCILDPIGSRKYASTGTYYAPRMGDPGKPFVLESVTVLMKTGGANVNITPSIITDDTTTTAYSAWTSAGRKTLTLTPGTADQATTYQVKFAASTNSNASTPVLIGGGMYVRGHYAAPQYDEIIFVIHAGTFSSSGIGTDATTIFSTLKGYEGTVQNVVYLDYFGDSSNHSLHIVEVQYEEGKGDTPQASERFITVRARTVAGTT